MQSILMLVGGCILLFSAIPYLRDIINRKTKPKIVSWITWTLLGAIATGASLAEGHYPSAILTTAATIETALIVIFGWRYGNREFERFDICCQVAAVLGLGLWFVFNSPLIALAAALIIDAIAAMPTIRHAWQKPHEETAKAFALGALAAFCTILSMDRIHIQGVLFPLYLLTLNAALVIIIYAGHHRQLSARTLATVPVTERVLP